MKTPQALTCLPASEVHCSRRGWFVSLLVFLKNNQQQQQQTPPSLSTYIWFPQPWDIQNTTCLASVAPSPGKITCRGLFPPLGVPSAMGSQWEVVGVLVWSFILLLQSQEVWHANTHILCVNAVTTVNSFNSQHLSLVSLTPSDRHRRSSTATWWELPRPPGGTENGISSQNFPRF